MNKHLVNDESNPEKDLKQYEAVIDYLDVIEVNKMNLVNEKAVMSENPFIRDAYKFEIFVQMVLTAVNGVTLKRHESNNHEAASLSEGN